MRDKEKLDQISRRIIGAAIEVHRHLGPGLLESAYQSCLAFELKQLGLKVEEQKSLPVVYKQVKLDCGYRLEVGLLMNFHVPVLKNGLKRIVNEFPDAEWAKRQAPQTE
jgi:PD-(D/E)XK nuclease superfamily